MKKSILLLLLAPFFLTKAYSLDIDQATYTINFGETAVGATYTQVYYLKNNSTNDVEVSSIDLRQNLFSVFALENFEKVIHKNDSLKLTFTLKPAHNTNQIGTAFVKIKAGQEAYTLPISLSATAKYSDTIYKFTQNLVGEDLKAAIVSYLQGHTAVTYNQARNIIFTDIDNRNGVVQCVYTGETIQTTTLPSDKIFNTEHTWAQSKGATNEPQKSDLFHLYPTKSGANSDRGNLPFGEPISGIDYTVPPESKWGENANKVTVFEPRNAHKGNVARSMFYFALTYGNPYSPFFDDQEAVLRKWHKLDTVDSFERKRNTDIFSYQKRRNPFIDHPEFVDRMPSIALALAFPFTASVNIDTNAVIDISGKDTSIFNVYIYNPNMDVNKITKLELVDNVQNAFEVVSIDSNLNKDSYSIIKLRVLNGSFDSAKASLKIKFSKASLFSSYIYLKAINTKFAVKEDIRENNLVEIYPNPASSKIFINSKENAISGVRIYDINGSLIASKIINNERLIEMNISELNISNGTYFIEVQSENKSIQRTKIIVK